MGVRGDDCENLGEKPVRQEEREGLLDEYQDEESGVSGGDRGPKRQRLSKKRFWCALCAAIIVLLIAFLFLYQFSLSGSLFAQNWSQDAEERQPGQAIRLSPEDHRNREPRRISHEWNISKGKRAPDGVEKQVYLINDQFPGPTIQARSGDRLLFHVHNNLNDSEGLAIHWHGLFMRNANAMDGTLGVTQPAIPPGGDMLYEYVVADEQCGTFWYHAHSQLQRADGLYGGLVIHCPEEPERPRHGDPEYEQDVLLMVGDWFHRPAQEVYEWYHSYTSWGNEPVPDSLIINDGGSYNCSMAPPARPISCTPTVPPELLSLITQGTRLRIVNVGSIAGLTFHTTNAVMTPFEMDGGNPIAANDTISVGILYPGERVDLVIRELQTQTVAPTLEIIMDRENLRFGNPALSPNQTFHLGSSSVDLFDDSISSSSPSLFPFDLAHASSLSTGTTPTHLPPAESTILIYATTMLLSHLSNAPTGFINHTSFLPSTSPDALPLLSLPRTSWPDSLLAPQLAPDTWVDLVINNLDDGGHPFHLHGHDFYVLRTYKASVGWGSWNPFVDADGEEKFGPWDEKPRVKDTVFVPSKGHVVIRFKAQPGVWALHCHVLWHRAVGMGMVVDVR